MSPTGGSDTAGSTADPTSAGSRGTTGGDDTGTGSGPTTGLVTTLTSTTTEAESSTSLTADGSTTGGGASFDFIDGACDDPVTWEESQVGGAAQVITCGTPGGLGGRVDLVEEVALVGDELVDAIEVHLPPLLDGAVEGRLFLFTVAGMTAPRLRGSIACAVDDVGCQLAWSVAVVLERDRFAPAVAADGGVVDPTQPVHFDLDLSAANDEALELLITTTVAPGIEAGPEEIAWWYDLQVVDDGG